MTRQPNKIRGGLWLLTMTDMTDLRKQRGTKLSMTFGVVMVMAMVVCPAQGADSLPVCGEKLEAEEGGCWQPLEGKRNCHIWNPNPQPDESATFEGRSRCRGGKVSGTGTVTWRVVDNGETRVSTHTGPYAEGKMNGRFVDTDDSFLQRSEGNYVDGSPHGHWVNTHPPGTVGVWDRWEGPWVDGVQKGKWTFVDYEEVDGEFRESEREEGPVVNGKRHGDWIRVRDNGEAVTAYVNGRRHGPYVEEFGDGRRQTGEYREGERVGRWVTVDSAEDIVEEQNWVQGKLHGKFVSTDRNGDMADRQVTGNFSQGLRDGLWVASYDVGGSTEETYVAGKKHGPEVETLANGFRRVGGFSDGWRTGQWSLMRPSGDDVLVEATYANDEATDLVVRGASLPSATAPPPGRAPLDGAFGLLFGPEGIDQIRGLECTGGRSCLGALADALLWTSPKQEEVHDSAIWYPAFHSRDVDDPVKYLSIRQPPLPVAGGNGYGVEISAESGLVAINTEIGEFSAEDSCEVEERRLRDLLTSKYGECTDYRYDARALGRTPIGQCDSRGMAERKITAFCHEKRGYVDGEFRTKHHYVRLSYKVVLEAERTVILNAWLKHGQVGAEDL